VSALESPVVLRRDGQLHAWSRIDAQECQRRFQSLVEGEGDDVAAALPFSVNDTTSGTETELQAVVAGSAADVDLPLAIGASRYYANLLKRSAAQDTPKRVLRNLQRFVEENREGVWDNSWVRLPLRKLSAEARRLLEADLRADKRDPHSPPRGDVDRFLLRSSHNEATHLRVPISYLLKLALADVISPSAGASPDVAAFGTGLLRCYQNDNISPETLSFHVVPLAPGSGGGRELARENVLRFLLTQLLTTYANHRFGLQEAGQRAIVYFSPHVPVRQRQLSEIVSDSFYCDLFLSPCLSGWDQGELKQAYMRLCHQVLSRSKLHAMGKVRDAGLVLNNLVVMPNFTSACLANNGTHVSLGSLRLKGWLEDPSSGFGVAEEKMIGDLAIKVVEHFLPLFVGTFSAAPYRFDFADFHAERVLAFLPHELDFTHLRMLWRRWKKKARNRLFGQPVTPSGYRMLDRLASLAFRWRGDFVPDFRLLDYLSAPLSTDHSPALDGQVGNTDRLKHDLAEQGEYDTGMSFYMLYRQRAFAAAGYSGFEGRYYSLCESLENDLAPAIDLQHLVTALAYHYIYRGQATHADIPCDPSTESERRQIFFAAAMGVPTFYVRAETGNAFLRRVLKETRKTRLSGRYRGYVRVLLVEYQRALVRTIRRDGAALVSLLGMGPVLDDLEERINQPAHSALGKLTQGVLREANARSPQRVSALEFNSAAERYYRDNLRQSHLREGLRLLAEIWWRHGSARSDHDAQRLAFLRHAQADLLTDRASPDDVRRLIHLVLETILRRARSAETWIQEHQRHAVAAAPIR
jgi:hypothetical protein